MVIICGVVILVCVVPFPTANARKTHLMLLSTCSHMLFFQDVM